MIQCCYCGKPCEKPEEQARQWRHPQKGLVAVCNPCGGYENCPACGKLWENLGESGTPCFDCQDKVSETGQPAGV